VGSGPQVLVVGYVVGGSGSTQSLLRAVGPTLSQYGITWFLGSPQLALYDSSGATIATNAGWGNAPVAGTSAVHGTIQAADASTFSMVDAFSLPTGSLDSALVSILPAATYTAQISGVGNTTGVALAELYGLDSSTPTARFVNLSARAFVGADSQALVAGFVISGTGLETVLIRAIGPTLSQYSVTGVLAAPQLTLYDSSNTIIATNTGWGSTSTKGPSTTQSTIQPTTNGIFSQLYAFPLPLGSADCAMIVTLPPGSYTAQVTGVNNTTGVGLVEVYEVQ